MPRQQQGQGPPIELGRVAWKLKGENLNVVWAEFSTLSQGVLQNVYNSWPLQTQLSQDVKSRPRFRSVSLSLSIARLVRPS
jgi:hypothetical protein